MTLWVLILELGKYICVNTLKETNFNALPWIPYYEIKYAERPNIELICLNIKIFKPVKFTFSIVKKY